MQVECPYCGKVFTGPNAKAVLGQHTKNQVCVSVSVSVFFVLYCVVFLVCVCV
jgi:hypothetical protein